MTTIAEYLKAAMGYIHDQPIHIKAMDWGAFGVGLLTLLSWVFDYFMPKALVVASFVWLCLQIYSWVEKRIKNRKRP